MEHCINWKSLSADYEYHVDRGLKDVPGLNGACLPTACTSGLTAACRQSFLPLKDACSRPAAELENGAHMEIGVNGDLSTLYWRQNGPWDPNTVPCRVTYGRPSKAVL